MRVGLFMFPLRVKRARVQLRVFELA